MKCIFEMLDQRGPADRPNHCDQVETAGSVIPGTAREEGAGCNLDAPPLNLAEGFLGILRPAAGSGLHLDEDKRIAVGADEVDLTAWAAVVPDEHSIPTALQVAGRCALTAPP